MPPLWFLFGFAGFLCAIVLMGGAIGYMLTKWIAEFGSGSSKK